MSFLFEFLDELFIAKTRVIGLSVGKEFLIYSRVGWVGSIHKSGRVGSGRVQFFPYLVGWDGSDPFVWVCMGHPGLHKMLC